MLNIKRQHLKLGIVFFFILTYFNFYGYTQTIDETTKLADELFKTGDYNNSLQLYKRVLFFSKKNKTDIFIKTGDCYFYMNDFELSVNNYDSASAYNNSEDLYNKILFKKADCYLSLKNYKKSLNLIENIKNKNDKDLRIKTNFYKGIIHFASADYKKSELCFLEVIDDTSKINRINLLFENERYLKNPNSELAGVLSSIIPGAGQLYSGDYKNAVNSFLLVSAFVIISTDMYLKYGLIDAVISIVPWLNRYYKGGYGNAKLSANDKRDHKRNEILNDIINIINKN